MTNLFVTKNAGHGRAATVKYALLTECSAANKIELIVLDLAGRRLDLLSEASGSNRTSSYHSLSGKGGLLR